MATLFDQDVAVVGFARVAVERGVDRFPDGLTYAVPEALADLAPGERVVVPLGRGDTPTPGFVVDRLEAPGPDQEALKPILGRDVSGAQLSPQLIELARWISSYYCTPIGMTLSSMLPAAVKRRTGAVTRTLIDLADPPASEHRPTTKQRRVLDVLSALPPERRPIELNLLAREAGLKTNSPIRRLVEAGVLSDVRRSTIEATWADRAADARRPERLTDAQRQVVEDVARELTAGFSTHLLFGVTGSGKTEVYIRLIEHVIRAGRVALMLVPEISLTPQTGGRLIGRFPDRRVSILHSGLTAAQRHQQWALAAEGVADIVIGARSAVFAPVPDGRLGLIIVDEEHDSSYKQDQAPRYHGRDVAIRRGQIAGVPIVLGSATPSLESWHNATGGGSSHLHRLTDRAPGLRLPTVQVVDLAEQRRRRAQRGIHLLGPVLEHALGRTLDDGGQALILLNRRGYASYITCPDPGCAWVMRCDYCDVTMVYHLNRELPAGGYVRCHHCHTEQLLPAVCPGCDRRLRTFGFGTQRVEEELSAKFPELVLGETMLRLDSDTMRSAQDYYSALDRFGAGEVRVLLGTQMIGKGLDYPGVRLVGVINADTAINLPDFRATERTFQLVNQVAGRCGRSEAPGTVVVQTFAPHTPAIALAAAHDYETFARLELEQRRRLRLPPVARLARIVVRDEDHQRAVSAARDLAAGLQELRPSGVRMLGPAPCPIARIAGRHRQQIELLAPSAAALQSLLAAARSRGLLRASAAMAIDVDPVALL